MADELPAEPEPPHVDFLRRMAEIDQAYDQALLPPPAEVTSPDLDNLVDLRAARQRLRG